MLKNDRLMRALLSQPVDCTPVWLMRQAGRYLPEFQKLRARVPNFLSFCKIPELACEATLQPLHRFELDAAIIFSDILMVPYAMGIDLEIVPTIGPVIHQPMVTLSDVDRLIIPDIQEALPYVMDAIRLVRQEVNGRVPLIGFAGSPWTVACYLIEGQGNKMFDTVRRLLYREPAVIHALLRKLTTVTIDYLNAQILAGAQAIMLFDTWGGLLTTQNYREFSLNYMSMIARQLHRKVQGELIPLIFFTKNSSSWLEMIAEAGCDAVSVDWTVDMTQARARIDKRIALQGNLDPAVLFAKPEQIRAAVKAIIEEYGPNPGHVFNLGHGIDQATPPDNVKVMVDAVHEFGGCE